jgi:hypothetical protein
MDGLFVGLAVCEMLCSGFDEMVVELTGMDCLMLMLGEMVVQKDRKKHQSYIHDSLYSIL